ncbi:MAG TPA: ATP-binding protein [Pyrinomonadaceae bacterium]|jgi:signal transduction histidine kinase|nr:ATP-binding protein [Pyrinomonadaceae bacterium]
MTLAHQQSPARLAQYSIACPTEDKRILIVDDDNSVRSLFEECLSERFSCAVASDFDEAMALLNRESFALVISDVIMPGRSGIELLREVTTRFPDTAIIMVSGVDRTQRVLDAVRLGAYDYLIKPCGLDVLELTVERALERRALLRAARQHKRDLERRNMELRQSKAKLERLQAQIVHSEKMASLGQLAAGVAHELNNPAGFIYGNMEVLGQCAKDMKRLLAFYDSVPLTAEVEAQARSIKSEIDYENTLDDLFSGIRDCHEGAERIRDVVNNLRLFSRLDEAEFKKVDIHEGLESTIRLLSRYYSSGSITLKRDYAELPPVDCYAGQLNQVWMNLLVNAAQAVGGVGEVRVTTRHNAEMALITITDTGCGIAPELLKKIFDPFFTTKPVGEGTGLGLSVSYSIIERHQGTISVESRLGQGTTFTVTIPINARRQDLDITPWIPE